MDPDVQNMILRRLRALEDTSVRFRMGEVTDTDPLDVTLGGATTSYEAVSGLAVGGGGTGDKIAALMWGNDLLVLGQITGTPMRIVSGAVTSAGAVQSGDGFGAAMNSTGNFTVTFTTAFSGAPWAVTDPVSGTAGLTQLQDFPTASAFTVLTFNTSGAASNRAFTFIAVGPA